MGTVDIFQAVASGGIRDTYFFNGRLLTADDLRTTQDAVAARDRQLGRAAGAGVAHGLEVTLSDPGRLGTGTRPTLHVTAGLALAHSGDVLELTDGVDVALVKEAEVKAAAAGDFVQCPPPQTITGLTNFGLYVLTLAPTSWFEGLAPMTQLQSEGVGSSCGRRYEVDGVRFGVTQLDLSGGSGGGTSLGDEIAQLATDLDTELTQLLSALPIPGLEQDVERKLSRLRNAVAHLCFGTEQRLGFIVDPLGSGSHAGYGALDGWFADGTVQPQEVPLALFYWSVRGVEFADMWSVRRPIERAPLSDAWAPYASPRQAVDGLALWLQFQDHVHDLGASSAGLQDIRAVDYFRYLPPVGVLPLADRAGAVGADYTRFFDTITARGPEFLNGARAYDVIRRACRYPPIDPASGELIWRYYVRENVQAFNAGAADSPQTFLVFATGHEPFAAQAQFDLAHWDYANYV